MPTWTCTWCDQPTHETCLNGRCRKCCTAVCGPADSTVYPQSHEPFRRAEDARTAKREKRWPFNDEGL